ncbi:MAG: hypothetical protein ABEL76_00795, partial [Bradymonadaceae bacterium]
MLFMLLTLTVPLAAGLVELIVNRREETREAIREELRDRESARDELLETRERQAEVLGQLEDEEQRLESERSALKAKIRQLDEYAIEVEREIRERIEQERKLMHAYCRAVSGALARDRAAFLYHADEELLEPREDGSSDGAAALGTHLPDEGRARVEDAAAE